MKVFDIFFDWLKGLWTAGGILSRLLAILGVLVGMVLLIIAIILNFGIKLFKIFWDETLFYSSKGYSFFKQILNTFNQVLQFLVFYLFKLVTVLLPNKRNNLTKPTLKRDFLIAIIKDTVLAVFFYTISIIIFIISIYWLLTYVEIITHIGQWILSLFGSSYSLLDAIRGIFSSLETWSKKIFTVNLFSISLIWIIRIVGFCGIFLVRFLRLKKSNTSLELSSIVPYKKPFWDNQVQINSNYRVIYSIAFSVLIVLLIAGILFFPRKDKQVDFVKPQTENIEVPVSDTLTTVENNKENAKPESLIKATNNDEKEKQVPSINNNKLSDTKEKETIQAFDITKCKTSLNNVLINIKAQEYNYSMRQLDIIANMKNIPLELKKKILEAKTFIKAKEDADAINVLNQIISSN